MEDIAWEDYEVSAFSFFFFHFLNLFSCFVFILNSRANLPFLMLTQEQVFYGAVIEDEST